MWLGVALYALTSLACAQDGGGIVRIERVRESPVTVAALPQLPDSAFETLDSTRQLAGTHGRGWWRVQPAAGDERLLLVYHPYSAKVTVLAPPDYRPRIQTVFDADLDPRFSRRALAFPLQAPGPVFIGIEGARYPLQIEVQGTDAHIAADITHLRIITTVIGVLVGISFVVLMFWLLLREHVYLLYAATMVFQLLYLLCAYGEAYALPGLRWLARFGAPGVWTIATLSTVAGSFFLIDLADLRQYTPRLARALRWVGGYISLLLLALLVSPWPVDKQWFPLAGNLALLIANVLAVVALLVAWWRGNRRAGYALLAWVPLVTLSTARAVQLSAGATLTPMIEYGLPVALAFASVLLVLVLADHMQTVRRERDYAQHHAERDPLTGVLNRAGIEDRLDWAIVQSRKDGQDLAVLFLDLDRFKRINDNHGHAAGDACLRALVRAVGTELQYGDQLGRYGGEEFLLVLPGHNLRHARDTAERIRVAVERDCAGMAGVAAEVLTASIGVAVCADADSARSLITRADEAMYAAKHAGRNRVVVLRAGESDDRAAPRAATT